MKLKRIISVLTVILLCIGSSGSVYALNIEKNSLNEPPITTLRWSNTSSVECTLGFTGKTAVCSAKVVGYSGATITSTMTLYKQNGSSWDYVTSWNKDSSTQTVTHSQNYTVDSTGTYKLVIDAYVYSNGYNEPVSRSHEVVCK